ncbi:MAG: radical SAM protein [Clostridia bacterium]|nr:radical SAM protein [Clostridia bacterium]
MEANIANIQHFSVGDGAGIRTTVFFKGCNLRCPWCHNPEAIPAAPITLRYPEKSEICGRRMRDEEILADILEDAEFYAASGGGVTFSGGEVLLQAEAAARLARQLKALGISLWIDTAGCVPADAIDALLPLAEAWLFDYKSADELRLRDICGAELSRIEENLTRLLSAGADVHLRIPLIPGFNTGEGDLRAIGARLQRLGIRRAELLAFHRLGVSKYDALGLPYPYRDIPPQTPEELSRIRQVLEEYVQISIEP